ncbi:hypothetical protein DFJ74DRAFT_681202 [Hyaloraphidium curvatum]|nr:hypothetical protein DFJ74DRAFT_681202 [Hyaloraphidium curvatum]
MGPGAVVSADWAIKGMAFVEKTADPYGLYGLRRKIGDKLKKLSPKALGTVYGALGEAAGAVEGEMKRHTKGARGENLWGKGLEMAARDAFLVALSTGLKEEYRVLRKAIKKVLGDLERRIRELADGMVGKTPRDADAGKGKGTRRRLRPRKASKWGSLAALAGGLASGKGSGLAALAGGLVSGQSSGSGLAKIALDAAKKAAGVPSAGDQGQGSGPADAAPEKPDDPISAAVEQIEDTEAFKAAVATAKKVADTAAKTLGSAFDAAVGAVQKAIVAAATGLAKEGNELASSAMALFPALANRTEEAFALLFDRSRGEMTAAIAASFDAMANACTAALEKAVGVFVNGFEKFINDPVTVTQKASIVRMDLDDAVAPLRARIRGRGAVLAISFAANLNDTRDVMLGLVGAGFSVLGDVVDTLRYRAEIALAEAEAATLQKAAGLAAKTKAEVAIAFGFTPADAKTESEEEESDGPKEGGGAGALPAPSAPARDCEKEPAATKAECERQELDRLRGKIDAQADKDLVARIENAEAKAAKMAMAVGAFFAKTNLGGSAIKALKASAGLFGKGMKVASKTGIRGLEMLIKLESKVTGFTLKIAAKTVVSQVGKAVDIAFEVVKDDNDFTFWLLKNLVPGFDAAQQSVKNIVVATVRGLMPHVESEIALLLSRFNAAFLDIVHRLDGAMDKILDIFGQLAGAFGKDVAAAGSRITNDVLDRANATAERKAPERYRLTPPSVAGDGDVGDSDADNEEEKEDDDEEDDEDEEDGDGDEDRRLSRRKSRSSLDLFKTLASKAAQSAKEGQSAKLPARPAIAAGSGGAAPPKRPNKLNTLADDLGRKARALAADAARSAGDSKINRMVRSKARRILAAIEARLQPMLDRLVPALQKNVLSMADRLAKEGDQVAEELMPHIRVAVADTKDVIEAYFLEAKGRLVKEVEATFDELIPWAKVTMRKAIAILIDAAKNEIPGPFDFAVDAIIDGVKPVIELGMAKVESKIDQQGQKLRETVALKVKSVSAMVQGSLDKVETTLEVKIVQLQKAAHEKIVHAEKQMVGKMDKAGTRLRCKVAKDSGRKLPADCE